VAWHVFAFCALAAKLALERQLAIVLSPRASRKSFGSQHFVVCGADHIGLGFVGKSAPRRSALVRA